MNVFQKSLYCIDRNYYVIPNNKEAGNMSIALNYQLSIFGNYSLSPSPTTVTDLMSKINAETGEMFLPNIINTQQVEVPANRISTISNLGFVSQNQRYNIAILNDRIDITYNKNNEADVDINHFYELATKALNCIMDYAKLSAYRLAANIQMVNELSDFGKLQALGKRLIVTADYYNEKPLLEWSNRVNSQAEIDIMGKNEGINVITDISTAQSVQGKPATLYHIDINTLPQNQSMRFSRESLYSFVEKILPITKEIIVDVERLIIRE